MNLGARQFGVRPGENNLKRRLCAIAAVVALTGCSGTGGDGDQAAGNAAKAASQQPTPASSAKSGFGSAKDSGNIPDPCTLLSQDEVVGLTGRKISQVDEDGAEAISATRFCQWQQTGGQLAIFLSRTTKADFDAQIAGASPVDGVGENAFGLAGHLYVLYGTVQIDVYSRGGTEDENLVDAKKVAEVLIPRV